MSPHTGGDQKFEIERVECFSNCLTEKIRILGDLDLKSTNNNNSYLPYRKSDMSIAVRACVPRKSATET